MDRGFAHQYLGSSVCSAQHIIALALHHDDLTALFHWLEMDEGQPDCAYIIYIDDAPEQTLHGVSDYLLAQSNKRVCRIINDPVTISRNNHLLADTVYLLESTVFLSANHYYHHLGQHFGGKVCGILLSQQGDEGYKGCEMLRKFGGTTFQSVIDWQYFFSADHAIDFVGQQHQLLEKLMHYLHPVISHNVMTSHYAVKESQAVYNTKQVFEHAQSDLTGMFEWLQGQTGFDFNQLSDHLLANMIANRMRIHGDESVDQYSHRLGMTHHDEAGVLYRSLLAQYSTFESNPYASIVEYYGNNYVQKGDDVPSKIWFVGCSTGEQVYQLAIALDQWNTLHDQSIPWKIFASAIQQSDVKTASKGVYSNRLVRFLPDEIKQQYFNPMPNGSWCVKARLRQSIVFSQHDFTTEKSFTEIDMIVSAVELRQFKPQVQKQIQQHFDRTLVNNGLIAYALADRQLVLDKQVINYDIGLFRKLGERVPVKQQQSYLLECEQSVIKTHPEKNGQSRLDQPLLSIAIEQLLDEYLYPTLIANADMNVVQSYGDLSAFIQRYQPGRRSDLLDEILHPSIHYLVKSGIDESFLTRMPYVLENLTLGKQTYHIKIKTLQSSGGSAAYAMVSFINTGTAEHLRLPETTQRIDCNALELTQLHAIEKEKQQVVEELRAVRKHASGLQHSLKMADEKSEFTEEKLSALKGELYEANHAYQTLSLNNQKQRYYYQQCVQQLNTVIDKVGTLAVVLDKSYRVVSMTTALCKRLKLEFEPVGVLFSDLDLQMDAEQLQQNLCKAGNSQYVESSLIIQSAGQDFSLSMMPYIYAEEEGCSGVMVILQPSVSDCSG